MKFMKLGFRVDTFYTLDDVRSVTSEISSDLVIELDEGKFLLHKFPLFAKCLLFQRDLTVSNCLVCLPDFPGGSAAFELCAKFCYDIMITISSCNIVTLRCAAEYLQMTEEAEKGNLIQKLDVFFTSSILHGWKDCIFTLQATKSFPSLSEELGITSRCIEAISSMVLARPEKVNPSHSRPIMAENGAEGQSRRRGSVKGWWAEDIAELSVDLYRRTMEGIKSGREVPSVIIGAALKIYTRKSLPAVSDRSESQMLLLETIVGLLPCEKGAVSFGFLVKLLKVANVLSASPSSKAELVRRVGIQLDEAVVGDLLVPSGPEGYTGRPFYDIDIVIGLLRHFNFEGESGGCRRRRSLRSECYGPAEKRVAKIIDGYLRRVGVDTNLPLLKVFELVGAVPDRARVDHDDLYEAVNIYLKAHPGLSKWERKRLCGVLDCKKLSFDVCIHAARNELLPLRIVVRVLFFQHARAELAARCNESGVEEVRRSKTTTSLREKMAEEDDENKGGVIVQGRNGPRRPWLLCSSPLKCVWMRLWLMKHTS